MVNLKSYIKSRISLTDIDLEQILNEFTIVEFAKDEPVIKQGQYVKDYFFIENGGVRLVVDTPKKEVTAWIIFENNFISNLKSIRKNSPSDFRIMTLEKSNIYRIRAKQMDELCDKFPKWRTFKNIILEDEFLKVVKTLISFQTLDAEERYLQLIQESDLIKRAPLNQVASYLGITPNSLSRIRKNIY